MSCGHLITGICLGLTPKKLDIMPFGITVTFEDYKTIKEINEKKAIIAFAGPLTNLIIILLTYITKFKILNISPEMIIYSNILICLFNLLPIYPLDGGRIIKSILNIRLGLRKSMKITNVISNTTVIILTIIASIAILYIHNVAIVMILIYLWYLVIMENKKERIKSRTYEIINKMT